MKHRLFLSIIVQLLIIGCVQESIADQSTISDEEIRRHVRELETWVPKGFKIVVEKPFVVIGNETRVEVARRANQTVRWTVERLKQDYFDRDPSVIIDIWLFRDGPSYRRYTRELFGYTPDTPYGFYLESEQALIMNIGTGAGTLNHELVHPFMAANFPDCPPWFNEGLGSLYECSTTRDGHIWGLTNWRVTGLKDAIRRGTVPSFEKLMSMNELEFYEHDQGTNYAQSRYLLQYLQEKGLLVIFYREFLLNREADPTGIETLKRIAQITDLDAFKTGWEKWVNKLRLDR